MAAFIYRCPNTGLRIQALAAAEMTEDENKYEPVTCVMCRQVHLVNPWTGKVLGDDDDRPHRQADRQAAKGASLLGKLRISRPTPTFKEGLKARLRRTTSAGVVNPWKS